MRWWLTTHYPHQSPNHPWNIYVREEFRGKYQDRIQFGDGVAFYELKGRLGNGRRALIGFARVTAPISENKNREGSKDEGDRVWEWQFVCENHAWKTLAHDSVCKIIGRKSGGALRLRGGLKELSKEQFDELKKSSR